MTTNTTRRALRTARRFVWTGVAVALLTLPPTGGAEAGQRNRRAKRNAATTTAVAPVETVAPVSTVDKLDAATRRAVEQGDTAPQRVIIRTKKGMTGALVRALRNHGDTVAGVHASIDAVTALVHADDLAALAADPSVEHVSSDARVQAAAKKKKNTGSTPSSSTTSTSSTDTATTDTTSGGNWHTAALDGNHLRNTLGLDAWGKTWEGSGVTVAVIDSGLSALWELGKIKGFYDFTDGQTPAIGASTAPYDDYGHGTHVAGLISNDGNATGGLLRGVAPKVQLVGLKVLDSTGAGYTSDVIRAVDFAVAHREALDLDIINLSLGHPILEPAASDPLVLAVEAATDAGLIVVVSAGNQGRNPDTLEVGYAGITSPGNAPSAITVGAFDTQGTDSRTDDTLPAFSSRGPTWFDAFAKPNLVAPGTTLLSSTDTASALYLNNPNLIVEETGFQGDTTP
jgi:subtilisin family serine protease